MKTYAASKYANTCLQHRWKTTWYLLPQSFNKAVGTMFLLLAVSLSSSLAISAGTGTENTGTVAGARLSDGVVGLVPLYAAGLGIAAAGTGWGLGLAYRFRDMRGAAIMQLTLFIALFLTEAQTPLTVMTGWLHTVARINPFTNVLRLARAGFLGEITWDKIWGGVLALVVLSALTLWFARRGLDQLEN